MGNRRTAEKRLPAGSKTTATGSRKTAKSKIDPPPPAKARPKPTPKFAKKVQIADIEDVEGPMMDDIIHEAIDINDSDAEQVPAADGNEEPEFIDLDENSEDGDSK